MKKKILLALVLVVSVIVFYSFGKKNNVSVASVSALDTSNKFLTGAMSDGIDYNYSHSPEIGLNVWHNYTAPSGGGWIDFSGAIIPNDNYTDSTPAYANAIRQRLDSNNSHNMFTLMDRPKFQYLAYGQRSDYQCEPIQQGNPFWFYSYDSSHVGTPVIDSSQFGEDQWVRHCTTNNGQGWIVKNLRANREQANYSWPYWINDDTYPWYVMPRIRINPGDTATNKRVCRIDIVKWDSTILKSIELGSRNNFRTLQNPYNGQYLEEYFFGQTDPKLEFGPGTSLNPTNIPFNRDTVCHIDFRVWYYNECEMWIDRVRVENFPAHNLLTLHRDFEEKMIPEEVNQISLPELNSNNQSPLKYYVEEFEFNTVPCMSFISKKVDSLTDHKMSFMVNLNYELFNAHIPHYSEHWFTADDIKTYLIDPMEAKEIFMGAYALEGWQKGDINGDKNISYSPNTLPVYNNNPGVDYAKNSGILSYKDSPSEYDDWLQDHFDNNNSSWLGTKYTYLMKMGESISKNSGIPFYNLMQAHLWWSKGHKLKEPSNEELKLMSNLAITYGVKGIMYFSYNSIRDTFTVANDSSYERGLVNFSGSPRENSVYGQNKWKAIKEINSTLKKWSPHIMSFDNTNKSYILRNEYSNLYSQTYFTDVVTYRPFGTTPSCYEDDPNSSASGAVFECREDRYLQVHCRRCWCSKKFAHNS